MMLSRTQEMSPIASPASEITEMSPIASTDSEITEMSPIASTDSEITEMSPNMLFCSRVLPIVSEKLIWSISVRN